MINRWQLRQIIGNLGERLMKFLESGSFNLSGDRTIEWSWIVSQMPSGPGKALDFGCGESYLGLVAAKRGFETIAIDLTPVHWFYIHPNLRFIQKDISELNFSSDSLDLIINCSSIEHVGLVGRYGVKKNQSDGDLEAMTRLRSLMKPKGIMLLTIPVGQDAVFAPLHRVYGEKRLPRLLQDFVVEKKEYWIKNKDNQWVMVDEKTALKQQPKKFYYSLGCFILRPKIKT